MIAEETRAPETRHHFEDLRRGRNRRVGFLVLWLASFAAILFKAG